MKKFRKTTLIAVFCLSVLAGVGLARKISFTPGIPYLFLTPLLLLLRKRSILSLLMILAFGVGVGLWRGGIYMQNVYSLRDLTGQKVMIEAKATTGAVYSKRSQIEFTANHINLLSPEAKPLAGSFKISGFGEPMIYRGDTVRVMGKLFPMRGSNQARIAYAQLSRQGSDSSLINDLTRKFDAGMQNALPEPQSSFGLGLLIGQRTTLPQNITLALTAVGLVHIVAVSGYNLTILVRAVGRINLGSKYQKLVLSLALIAGFILVTGFSASIVRAAFVSVLSLWAWYYGRQIKPIVLISFAAAVTGLWNPFYVWGDLGWYLSFLAFFGVLVIAPLIAARFFRKSPKLLTMVVLETLSAEIMTLPLILMTFSQLSLIALVANALVVPLVPIAMLLSAISGAGGMLIPQFAGWLAFPARLLLTYMLDIVHLMASVPQEFLHVSITPVLMIGFYASVIIIIGGLRKKLSLKKPDYEESQAGITP
jgi:competence protein ComEC